MRRRLLWYSVATLLAIATASSEKYNPDDDCPPFCKCDTSGTSGISAECTDFDTTHQFGFEITYLDISNIPKSKGLKLTDRIFANAGLKRVSVIKIVNSALETIDVNAFHGLHNLNELNLSNNHLGLLEPDMFANNTHLEKLSLSQNPLQNMQVESSPFKNYFLNIPSLQELDLSSCSISHLLPTMFNKLTTLVYINLASNEITDISKETFAPLTELEELDLSNNKLTQLRSDMFEQNTELSILTLKNNLLTSLSGVSIESLRKLDLRMCHFTEINKDTFAGFPDLSDLNLYGNAITVIDAKAFSNMKELHYLDLSNNKLTEQLPDDLFVNNNELESLKLSNNPEMKSLPEAGFQGTFSELSLMDISRCGLTHLEEDSLKGLNHLARLNLSRNEIQYLKPGVLNAKIVVLDLSRNKIAHLDQVAFPSGSSLKQLYLSNNPIKKLSPSYFINTQRLVKLDLKACELKQLWEFNESELQATSFKSLIYLNVANNKIKNLSVNDLYLIDHVQTLVLSGNPLTCNNDLKEAIKYLTESAVASSDATERKHYEELRKDVSEDAVDLPFGKDKLGWKTFLMTVCENKQNLIVPDVETDDSSESVFSPFVTEPSEDNDNAEVIYITDSSTDNIQVENIQREPVINAKTNYMWPIIIVALSAFAIILALVVLAALFLRWSRQKNSYRNKILRRHSILNTPRLRRGGSTVYQQLYDDANMPTTPVIPSKLSEHGSEQQTYTFPEKNENEIATTQTTTNASYLSSSFHHSNIVPESV